MSNKEGGKVLFGHCTKVYEAMENQAEYDEEHDTLMWQGSLTKLFQELGYGVPSYSRIMNALKGMDCVVQLQRGNGTNPSIWLLLREPTDTLYNFWVEQRNERSRRPKPGEQRMRDLENRVASLEGEVNTLLKRWDEEKVMLAKLRVEDA